MSRSDKRGATLPKVVAMSIAKLTDEFPEGWFTNPIYIMIYTPRPIFPLKKRKNKKLKILSKIVEKCLTLKYGCVKMSRLSMR